MILSVLDRIQKDFSMGRRRRVSELSAIRARDPKNVARCKEPGVAALQSMHRFVVKTESVTTMRATSNRRINTR